MSALYEHVTGKPYPKSGAKNIKAAKAELDRYVVYQKACEIDLTEKRKKPVIVTEVYDPPLPAETDRGRSGEYIDLLRPLLLSQDSFEGKLCALCNRMGLFDAYIEMLKENPVVKRKGYLEKMVVFDLSSRFKSKSTLFLLVVFCSITGILY